MLPEPSGAPHARYMCMRDPDTLMRPENRRVCTHKSSRMAGQVYHAYLVWCSPNLVILPLEMNARKVGGILVHVVTFTYAKFRLRFSQATHHCDRCRTDTVQQGIQFFANLPKLCQNEIFACFSFCNGTTPTQSLHVYRDDRVYLPQYGSYGQRLPVQL